MIGDGRAQVGRAEVGYADAPNLKSTAEPKSEATACIDQCHVELSTYEKLLCILEDKLTRILEAPNPDCCKESEPPRCTALGRDLQEIHQRTESLNFSLNRIIRRINL